jgi:hypothetical protein
MIGRISSGKYPAGIFNYLEREKSEIISKNVFGSSPAELTKEFLLCAELNPRVEKIIKHHVISFAPEDKDKINSEMLNNLINDYLEKSGYTNNQYAAFMHNDTHQKHLHLVINKVDFDGKNTHPYYEKKQARKILMELEEKYDLRKTPEKSLNPEKNYNRGEKEMIERYNKTHKPTDKMLLKNLIKEGLIRAKTEDRFIFLMGKNGVKVEKNKAGNGYRFHYNGRIYKGSTIDRNLSYAKIQEHFEKSHNLHKNHIITETIKPSDNKDYNISTNSPQISSGYTGTNLPGNSPGENEDEKKKKKKRNNDHELNL